MPETTSQQDTKRGVYLIVVGLIILVATLVLTILLGGNLNVEGDDMIGNITKLIGAIAGLVTALAGLLKVIQGFRKKAPSRSLGLGSPTL